VRQTSTVHTPEQIGKQVERVGAPLDLRFAARKALAAFHITNRQLFRNHPLCDPSADPR
jgi:hypothetical protein